MPASALLFDLDGTIWDSIPCYAAALCDAMDATPDDVAFLLHHGEDVAVLARQYGLSESKLTQLCLGELEKLQLYLGVPETLKAARNNDLPTGVVTNVPEWLINPIIRNVGIADQFDTMVCAAEKPNAKGILKALQNLGLSPNRRAFYIGDLASDAHAAADAAISFAWSAYGYGKKRPPNTALAINTFSDILALL